MSSDLLKPLEGSWNKEHIGYKWAVLGYSRPLMEDTPEFTNCTKTLEGAGLVEDRFKVRGLLARIVPIGEMVGSNPHYEKDL